MHFRFTIIYLIFFTWFLRVFSGGVWCSSESEASSVYHQSDAWSGSTNLSAASAVGQNKPAAAAAMVTPMYKNYEERNSFSFPETVSLSEVGLVEFYKVFKILDSTHDRRIINNSNIYLFV